MHPGSNWNSILNIKSFYQIKKKYTEASQNALVCAVEGGVFVVLFLPFLRLFVVFFYFVSGAFLVPLSPGGGGVVCFFCCGCYFV